MVENLRLTKEKLIRWSFFLFLIFIPFGAKKFLFSFENPFSNHYTGEYNSAFLYASDILLISFLTLFFFGNHRFSLRRKVWLIIFIAFSLLSVFLATYYALAFYYFFRLVLVIMAALALERIVSAGIVKIKGIIQIIAISAVFQGIVAFFQFSFQRSAGLWFLGETVITPVTTGIAKIKVSGADILRAYGTMPHANILAGFLVLGLLSLIYLFFSSAEKTKERILVSIGFFPVLLGLVLTFSRSGWLIGLITAILAILWGLLNKNYRRRAVFLSIILAVSLSLIFLSLGWSISSRAHLSGEEGPVKDRLAYDYLGVDIISKNPLGVGIGNELFYAFNKGFFNRYSLTSLGQYQPIHNIYLLIGSEVGLLGLIAFLFFLGKLIIRNFSLQDLDKIFACFLFLSLLLFGLVDHFLWDLESGRLMFWVVLGIIMSASPRSDALVGTRAISSPS
ncbi:MAG: O-antigen ligase family protein [Patescibacteria group bacterium]